MTDTPKMQMCACGEGCEDRASVKWRGYLAVECVSDQEAGRLMAAITEGMADAVAEERAAVVAWLRERQPGWPAGSGGHADAIERGDHRREEGA